MPLFLFLCRQRPVDVLFVFLYPYSGRSGSDIKLNWNSMAYVFFYMVRSYARERIVFSSVCLKLLLVKVSNYTNEVSL